MVKTGKVVVALLVTPVAALSACTSNQTSGNNTSTSSSSSSASAAALPPGTQRLSTQLKAPDGSAVANATLDFANGYATVTVETAAPHILTPGFHGMHIHSTGKCEANSVAPTGGPPGDFNSAGGHFQVPGHTGHPASGDLTSLEVRADGSAKLVTTTDSFTAQDLLNTPGTALIIHANPDNFGNIPPDRYTQKNGAPGPDQETLATGDSGKRVACGVIGSASTTSTTSPTTAVAPPATATVTTGASTTAAPTSVPTSAPGGPVPPGPPPAPSGG
jgi:Cu-Zn family superoxide dismutase